MSEIKRAIGPDHVPEEAAAMEARNRFVRNFFERTNEKLLEENELLQEQSMVDELTRALNRRGFQETIKLLIRDGQLPEELERRGKKKKTRLVLMALDIDHFKAINDELGHDAGDQTLVQFCKELKRRIRDEDLLVRWGGEEFLVAFPNATAEEILKKFGYDPKNNLDARFSFPVEYEGTTKDISASGGVVDYSFELSLDENLKIADQAVYQAKHSGRNKIINASALKV
jgi:two-component system, cell cycle response regulator